MSSIVPIIIIGVVCLQIAFFVLNIVKMGIYREVFRREKTWSIDFDEETGFVSGISGSGNAVFTSILHSINKYLHNNRGSVIEFELLKDAIDRHTDTVENEINTLVPVPLYFGLMGTMAGVIIGLWSLLSQGSISALLASDTGTLSEAALGINDLLSGVAWAMVASIIGIILTTISSLLFRGYKQSGESGKNTFLAWMQANLLPALPSDTSDALTRLVSNLNSFNSTFALNTGELKETLEKVNQSYSIQAKVIQAVHYMDVMKMAAANVKVLKELQAATGKLELFNQYLDSVKGYTTSIENFTLLFNEESDRLHILEEIRDFFNRHKAEIARTTVDADRDLNNALESIRENTASAIASFNKYLLDQSQTFTQILNEEKETFERLSGEMRAKFEVQLDQMPMLQKNLAAISEIPAKLDLLADRIDASNKALSAEIARKLDETERKKGKAGETVSVPMARTFEPWMKWTIVVSLIAIALGSLTNTAYNLLSTSSPSQKEPTQPAVLTKDTASPAPAAVLPADSALAAVDSGLPQALHENKAREKSPKR